MIEQKDYYFLGLLLRNVDEHIGTYFSYEELETGSFSRAEARSAAAKLSDLGLVIDSKIVNPDRPRRTDPMISLSVSGLSFCLNHELEILKAMMGGSVRELTEVREAFDRIRPPTDSGDTARDLRLGADIDGPKLHIIRGKISELIQIVEQSELDARERKNAVKRLHAVESLLEAPDPPWKTVIEILTSAPLTAFLNVAAILSLILG